MQIRCLELTPGLWPAFERLFGANGACGGCWCMHWRTQKGEKWEDIQGPPAKARMRALVRSGQALGVLAMEGQEPVGWASLGPRQSYAKLDRAPSLACADASEVWSVPCFFVKASHRGQGVAGALLAKVEEVVQRHGGLLLEGYPVRHREGTRYPPAFAWTGTQALFAARGFKLVGNKDGGKLRMRKRLHKPTRQGGASRA